MKTAEEWVDYWSEKSNGLSAIDAGVDVHEQARLQTIRNIQSDARSDLEQRVKELEKDKARLDWIQSNATELCCSSTGQWSALQPMGLAEPAELIGKGNSIRQAIDVAMKGEK